MILLFSVYFCTPKILFICLDSQIDFNISETCLRVAIREALFIAMQFISTFLLNDTKSRCIEQKDWGF